MELNNSELDADYRKAEWLDDCLRAIESGNLSLLSTLRALHPEWGELVGCLSEIGIVTKVPLPAVSPAPIETRFGKFVLGGEIGRGGMGVVYQAWQEDLQRPVALKMILQNHLASPEDVRRFYAEARAAGRLKHPNIVGIHEVSEFNGQHYYSMDFVQGESLAQRLSRGPISPIECVNLMVKIGLAVEYLHQQGIVHRDLKPSNILLNEENEPFVTDFGLAKIFQIETEETRSGIILGTPSYMPPEQAAGHNSRISVRSDVYSLGAILYEMLTGRPPFRAANRLDTIVQVLERDPTLLRQIDRNVPKELEWICLRCLEKDDSRRYQTAAEFVQDLKRYLAATGVLAQPRSLFDMVRRWLRREPGLACRLGGVLSAFSIIQLRFLMQQGSLGYHVQVSSLLVIWALFSFFWQKLLNREHLPGAVRVITVVADALLLTTIFHIADGPLGHLMIAFPLLVVASGLWFNRELVWTMTACTSLGYLSLLFARPEECDPWHYPLIFIVIHLVLGAVIAYQVQRVRALSRYFDERLGD